MLASGATISIDLDPATASCDRIVSMSSVTFGGTLQLNLVAGSYANGNAFTLFGATNYSGSFSNLVPASPGPGLKWNTNQLNVDGTLRVFSVPTPSPHLTSFSATGGNLVISASGGIPYDPCRLVTSTNLLTPLASWIPLATNRFDGAGTTSFTNEIPAGAIARFFAIVVD